MPFKKTTEETSHYDHLEKMSVEQLLYNINKEDTLVPLAVKKAIPQIQALTFQVIACLEKGGRLFYIGAGTSGRIGVLDASECPPTFGTDPDQVIGIIAGGDKALRNSIEGVEDESETAINDLQLVNLKANDVIIGISASGAAKYVKSALDYGISIGAKTVYLICNSEPFLPVNSDIIIKINTLI